MSRYLIIAVLAGVTVYLALVVASVTHEQRQAFSALNRLESNIDEEMYKWTQLLLERGSQASLPRVESQALTELGMKQPDLLAVEVFE